MQKLLGIYKFTYKKKQQLPDEPFISKRDDERCYFYQFDGSKYISLEILLNAYLSQIVRLSIGQCLKLIQLIYEKVIDVYKNKLKQMKLTLENIWIYTDIGFSGEIIPQKSMKIIFLNYQDEDVSLEENLKQLSLINEQIKKYCRETEFKIRATDGKNNILIQQIINIIDEMFYEVEMCLYEQPNEIQNTINNYVNNETQETDYEYFQESVQIIQQRYETTIKNLNQIFQKDCQSEVQLHKKLLLWQYHLFDCFIEKNWDRYGFEIVQETIQFLEEKIIKSQLDEESKTRLEHKYFKQLEEQGFFNFNSNKIRKAQQIMIQRSIQKELENNQKQKKQEKGKIDKKFEELEQELKDQSENIKEFNNNSKKRYENLIILKSFYNKHAQNKYRLYDRFYFTINLWEQWESIILDKILPDISKALDQENLEEKLHPEFQQMLIQNKIGETFDGNHNVLS